MSPTPPSSPAKGSMYQLVLLPAEEEAHPSPLHGGKSQHIPHSCKATQHLEERRALRLQEELLRSRARRRVNIWLFQDSRCVASLSPEGSLQTLINPNSCLTTRW